MAKTIKLKDLGKELRIKLDAEKLRIKENGEKAVRIAAIKTFSMIIKKTPVGNQNLWVYNHPTRGYIDYVGYFGKSDYVGGRARSNWMLGSTLTDNTTDSVAGKNNGATYINNELPAQLLDNKTYFYNNLPYITPLEYEGHSTQAPAGMVRISLLGWPSRLQKAFKDLE